MLQPCRVADWVFRSGKLRFWLRGVSEYFDITPTRFGKKVVMRGLRFCAIEFVEVMGCTPQELKFDVRVLLHSPTENRWFCSGKSGFVVFGMSEYSENTLTWAGARLEAIGPKCALGEKNDVTGLLRVDGIGKGFVRGI